MRFRSISFVAGLILAVGAFVALFIMGQVVNPSPYEVVIVVSEVGPGAPLTPGPGRRRPPVGRPPRGPGVRPAG